MLVEGAQGLGFQYWLRGAAFGPSANPLSLRCLSLSACLCQGLGRRGCICVCLSDTSFGFFTQSITLLPSVSPATAFFLSASISFFHLYICRHIHTWHKKISRDLTEIWWQSKKMAQMLLKYFIIFTVKMYLNSFYSVRLVPEKNSLVWVENTELVGRLGF